MRLAKAFVRPILLAAAAAFSAGCSGPDRPAEEWGFRGGLPGRFSSPRGIAADGDFVYAIDRTGRAQKFTHDGEYVLHWQLEEHQNGTPTSLSLDGEGGVWVADTHYSRILRFDGGGRETARFGEYGEEAGRFVFPTDIAFGENGELFIAEYGIHDRVQVFTREGGFVRSWGDFGDGPGEFNRPMAIAAAPDGTLYVADAANHRVCAHAPTGEFLFAFGREGTGPGELTYPYDLDVGPSGEVYTVEFGTHRVQRWSADGKPLGAWGSAGSGPENLAEPWGIAIAGGRVFIADTRNHRIARLPLEYLR